MLNLIPLPYRIGAVLLLAAAAAFYCFHAGQNSRQADWDKATQQQVAAQLAKNQADNAKLKSLEETKNANIAQLDKLRADNHALWLRLPKSDCGGSGQTGTDNSPGARELPTAPEIALKRFTEGLADEARRADGIVEACRVLNDYLK